MSADLHPGGTPQAADVLLHAMKVGTIVRTPGDFHAFSFDPAYRESGGSSVLSLSFRAGTGGLRKDARPLLGMLGTGSDGVGAAPPTARRPVP